MKLYHMEADLKNYQGLCTKNESDVAILSEFGKSLINNWKPLEFAVDTTKYSNIKKRIRPFSDYPYFGFTPVFSIKAYLAIKDLLETEGEFLKAVLNDVEYFMFNSFNRVNDIIDFKKSDFDYDKELDIIYEMKKYHINEEFIINNNFFVVPRLGYNIVSEKFVDIITKENLTGFLFTKIWG